METLNKVYTVNEVLSDIESQFRTFDGHEIKMQSQRYALFKRDGTICVECGIKGTHFKLQRHTSSIRFHFNLFTDHGQLMTKDHIIAKSNGGPNTMSNYQVMCTYCNEKKDNK